MPAASTPISLTRTLAAPAAEVWLAWTDGARLQWWFGAGDLVTSCVVEPKVGGRFVIECMSRSGAEFTPERIQGEVREASEPTRLVFTWSSASNPASIVTLELRAIDEEATRLAVTHVGLSGDDHAMHARGWEQALDSLGTFLRMQRAEAALQRAKREVIELKRTIGACTLPEYRLRKSDGSGVTLSELFAGASELLIIHNMGRKCRYCTLWADGFNGVWRSMSSRCPIVLVSPDEPEVQRAFAVERGWTIPMVSAAGTTFIRDLGFEPEPGRHWPGLSALKMDGGVISRTGISMFGPWDEFCPVWAMMELLDKRDAGWSPR